MVGDPLPGHVEQLTDLVARPHAGVPEDGVPAVLDQALQVEPGHPTRLVIRVKSRGHFQSGIHLSKTKRNKISRSKP